MKEQKRFNKEFQLMKKRNQKQELSPAALALGRYASHAEMKHTAIAAQSVWCT